MDTYGVAAHSFARSLVQLSAQQRGLSYFREHQPWRSMEAIPSTAALTLMDQAGWKIGSGTTPTVIAGLPDLARILRDTLPASTERRADSAPTLERLIPGSAATSFLSHEPVGSSSQGGLVQTIVVGTGSVDAEAAWPRVVWPAWPKADGLPWSFGQITISKRGLTGAEVMDLNPVSRMIILRAH
jgi:hypothetical protein